MSRLCTRTDQWLPQSDGTARNVGQAFVGWPAFLALSYMFSIEPEIDGDSIEGFGKSYREVLDTATPSGSLEVVTVVAKVKIVT